MQLLTQDLRRRLIQNGAIRRRLDEEGEADPDIAFGLADLGMGFPELGSLFVPELESARGPLGMAIERDLHFAPDFTIGVYARAALEARRIVEDCDALERAAALRKAELAAEGGAS